MYRFFENFGAGVATSTTLYFQAPGWAYIVIAIGLFIYQSLDAVDGKQARRTNTASPLGELFDHGCDAVSVGKIVEMIYLNIFYSCIRIIGMTIMLVMYGLCVFLSSVCYDGCLHNSSTGL